MAKVNYSNTSPWSKTPQTSWYLDLYVHRSFPADATDIFWEIPARFHHRPDLAAFELYGDDNLEVIFTLLNMSILKNPIYDFKAGTIIKIPTKTRVNSFKSS